ncbi:MAG: PIN domain-containing protein [Casimicrobiaceae bacterium]
MLGVDTNVLVGYLTRDDEGQFARARRLLDRSTDADEALFISLLVVQETEWVLRSRYHLTKDRIIETLSALLDIFDLAFEDEPALEEALSVWSDSNADFSDCLIGAHNRRSGCRATATFDARARVLDSFVDVE